MKEKSVAPSIKVFQAKFDHVFFGEGGGTIYNVFTREIFSFCRLFKSLALTAK